MIIFANRLYVSQKSTLEIFKIRMRKKIREILHREMPQQFTPKYYVGNSKPKKYAGNTSINCENPHEHSYYFPQNDPPRTPQKVTKSHYSP